MKKLLKQISAFNIRVCFVGFILLITPACQISSSLSPTPTPTVVSTPTFTPVPPSPTATVTPTNTPIPNVNEPNQKPFQAIEPILAGGILGIDLSPRVAEFMYTDPLGKRVGYDPISGKIVNDLVDQENARSYDYQDVTESGVGIYATSDEEDISHLFIFSPFFGEGSLTITGIGNGEYKLIKLFEGGMDGDNNKIIIITNTITVGEVQTVTIEIP